MRKVLIYGCLIRVSLILVLSFFESIYNQKMILSDIDYKVFSDASLSFSPYDRHTYRYSPLIAYMMKWNYTLYEGIGKLIFVLWDAIAIFMLWKNTNSLSIIRIYAYNPLFIYLTLRGSCEAITLALMYAFAYYMKIYFKNNFKNNIKDIKIVNKLEVLKHMEDEKESLLAPANKELETIKEFDKNLLIGAFIYGFWVHIRLYPIIILPWLLLNNYRRNSLNNFIRFLLTFGAISGGVFIGLSLLFYNAYGIKFFEEAYFFHLKRLDHRHSFSALFYEIYLNYSSANTLARSLPFIYSLITFSRSKLPLRIILLISTYAFVSFNKVITLQYFMWIWGALLLTLPDSTLYQMQKIRTAFVYSLHYFLPILAWIWFSLQLESKGKNCFFQMWLLCIAKLFVDIWVLYSFFKTIPSNIIKHE